MSDGISYWHQNEVVEKEAEEPPHVEAENVAKN